MEPGGVGAVVAKPRTAYLHLFSIRVGQSNLKWQRCRQAAMTSKVALQAAPISRDAYPTLRSDDMMRAAISR